VSHTPSRWEDAAFSQETLRRVIDGYFGELCDGYQQSAYGIQGVPDGLLRGIHRSLFQVAEPMYVSDDAFLLWEEAAKTFEPEALRRTDVVCPAGFALLPRPFFIDDVQGNPTAFRAIAWVPVSTNPNQRWNEGEPGVGLWVSLISHVDDRDISHDTDPDLWEKAKAEGWDWTLMHSSPMNFDERPWEIGPGGGPRDPSSEETLKRVATTVQSFWRLSSQLVAVTAQLPRPWRKQRRKQKMIEDVVIVRLRRPSGPKPEEEGDSGNWSHQWIVHGHWRNQWYPSLNTHRQIWISPYVKGPEDKPLIVKERVWEWTR